MLLMRDGYYALVRIAKEKEKRHTGQSFLWPNGTYGNVSILTNNNLAHCRLLIEVPSKEL